MATQNLGTLLVTLDADAKAFLSGMASASERVEKFAKESKKLANDLAQVGGALTAMGGAALALASTADKGTKAAMDGLTRSTQLLAVQVADMLMPAVKTLTDGFKSAANWVAGLDPAIKAQVASFAVWVAQAAVVAKVVGTVAGLVDAMAGALGSLAKGIGAIGLGPLLTVVAVVTSIIVAVVVLHRAWRKNWLGIQQITQDVIDWLGEAFASVGKFFKKVWKDMLRSVELWVNRLLDGAAVLEKVSGKKLGVDGLRAGFKGLFEDLESGEFFSAAVKFGKDTGKALAEAGMEEIAIIGEEVRAALKSALGVKGEVSKPGAKARQPVPVNAPTEDDEHWAKAAQIARTTLDEEKAARDALVNTLGQHNKEMEAAVEAREAHEKQVDAALGAALLGAGSELDRSRNAMKNAVGAGTWREAERTLRNELNKGALTLGESIKLAGARMLPMLTSALGSVGTSINNVMQGAQAGGAWGAIIAAVLELFQRMQSFQSMIKMLEYGLVRLGELLEPLFGPLFKFIGDATAMGTEMIAPLFEALAPLFESLAEGLQSTLPVMRIVGMLFKALAPILKALASVIGLIFKVLEPIMRVFFEVARVVLLVILAVLDAIISVWNALIDAVADIVKFIVDLFTAGQGGDAVAAEIRKAKGAGYAKEIEELKNLTYEQAEATVANTSATWEAKAANEAAAGAAQAVAESLTNMPSGYKIAASRYSNSEGDNPFAGLFGGSPFASGTGGSGSNVTIINGDTYIDASGADAEEVMDEAERRKEKAKQQRRGSSFDEDEF